MSLENGMLMMLKEGFAGVPVPLIKRYARLGLTETDVMLVIHLMAFKEREQSEFPTIEELQSRMSVSSDQLIRTLQKLMELGVLAIDEEIDPDSGIRYERYNVDGLFKKLAELCAAELTAERKAGAKEGSGKGAAPAIAAGTGAIPAAEREARERNLFTLFEQEFGRPLSPMECETISGWLDQDRYPEPLILAALKEAVFAGKLHFRYIDRILLEWRRSGIRTPEEAKEFAARFRGR